MPSPKSSFSVFKEVDDHVAKSVLGSDGAARWQDFKKASEKNGHIFSSAGVAPALPLKRNDRIGLGTRSIDDERAREAEVRREAGESEVGAGYTDFKRMQDHEEAAAKKRRKLVLDRVRPDEIPYFLKADTFEGFNNDYVFTTRDRGTGYYWDGMDSAKKELGQPLTVSSGIKAAGAPSKVESKRSGEDKVRAKKKKKVKLSNTSIEIDPNNPMEQVAQAILRRKNALNAPPSSLGLSMSASDAFALGARVSAGATISSAIIDTNESLEPELVATGWEAAKDQNSGKVYYFRRSTNERSWEKPIASKGTKTDEDLPDGWKSAKVPNSDKMYYYHTSGKTSWEKPKT